MKILRMEFLRAVSGKVIIFLDHFFLIIRLGFSSGKAVL
jgi:hypothetical protein